MICGDAGFLLFIFLFRRAQVKCEPKDSRRAASTAQNQLNQAKVTAQKHLKFRSSLFKGLWESKGQSPWSLPQERNTPAHSNEQSKIKRRKAKLTNPKSAMQLKRLNPTDVTSVTI